MQNEPQPSVKRIYARICIIIGILGIACTYSPLILPVPWKTETKVLLVVIGGILILCSLVIKFHLLRCPYCGWGGLIPQWYRNDTYLSQVRQPDPLGIRPCADTTEQKGRDADMRFKLLPIFAALLLLCGCGGARTLADVSGCGQWDRVQIIEWYEQGGSAGTQLPADSLSPDTLRELLGSTYVRRSYASMELPVPCVQIFLTADDGALFPLAVGENGRVILSDHSGSAAKDTYWKTGSPALYRSLLSAAGTKS